MLHDDRRRAGSFGDDAEQYDRARPSYPAPLIDDLVDEGAHAVLDVGCGTGKVGRLFADRGCAVLGVEPDERMAAVARRHGLTVEIGRFEAWDPRGRMFDLVVAGQTWHWVEPDAGAQKASLVLRPDGRLAVFWNRASLPADLKDALQAAYGEVVPGLATHSILLGNTADTRFVATADSFRRNAALGDPQIVTYTWVRRYTTDEWLDVLPTHSDHRTLPADRLGQLTTEVRRVLVAFGGEVDVTYDTVVVTAHRRR